MFKHQSAFAILIASAVIIGGLAFYYTMESQNNAKIEPEQSSQLINNNQTKAYAKQIVTSCKSDIHCPVLGLNKLNKTESRQIVLGTFSDLVLLYDKTDYDCHETAHHLGMWLYGYTTNLQEALSYANQLCDGGVFHGIFQSYFMIKHLQNVDANQITITQLCSVSQKNINWLDKWNCIHGIGHGLTDLYDYSTTSAVDRCNEFEQTWAQSTCSKGVYMENEVHYAETGEGDFDKSDLYYPCDKTVEKFSPECYHYHAQYLFNKNNYNISASFDQCDKISPGDLTKYCYHGIGRVLWSIAYRNVEQGISDCYLGKQSIYHADCLRGMVRSILKVRSNTDVGFQFCSASRPDFKAECYDIVGQWIKMLYPDQQEWKRECSKAHDVQYVANCMNANPEAWIKEL